MVKHKSVESKYAVKVKVEFIYRAFQQHTLLTALQSNKWHKQRIKLYRLHTRFFTAKSG